MTNKAGEQPTITQADIEIADKANEYVLFNDECRHSSATVAAAMARTTSLAAQVNKNELANRIEKIATEYKKRLSIIPLSYKEVDEILAALRQPAPSLAAQDMTFRKLADRAITCVEDVVRETSWGQPTFGPDCGEELRTEYETALARIEPSLAAQDGLVEFAKHTNWELDHSNIDPTDESSECVWRVHSVNGGRNDREWTLLGTGDTPQEAIDAALSAIKGDKS